MKKLIVLLFPIVTFAQNNFKVTGNFSNLSDSTLVFITDVQGTTIAQDYAINGKFTLSGKTEHTSYFQIGFIGIKEVYELFMGNNIVTLNGDVKNLKITTSNGSTAQKEFTHFLSIFIPLNENLSKQITNINSEKNAQKRDSLIKKFETQRSLIKNWVNKFVTEKPSSFVSSFLLYQFQQLIGDDKTIEQKFKTFKGDATKGLFATLLAQKIETAKAPTPGSIGSFAVDFIQNDEDDKPVSLSSFKGKYVLLDFWASWCGILPTL